MATAPIQRDALAMQVAQMRREGFALYTPDQPTVYGEL